jgi:polyhydroxyalkanoate synthesis regulator phasin
MATKATTFPGLPQVQESIRSLQSEGERLFARAGEEVGKLISKDQQKVIDGLIDQANAIRDDIQKRTEKVLKGISSRAGKILSQLEAQAKRHLSPLARRFSLPSRHEVELLAKRLSSLEKKVDELAGARVPTPPEQSRRP